MPWQGAGENNRAQRNRESVFPPARPHSAGSGECGALAASAGDDGFGAGNDIAAVRRSGAGDIFRYQLLSENIRARCAVRLAESGIGTGQPAPHGATGKAFFRPPVGIQRVRANAPALRRGPGARRPPPCPGKARRAWPPRSPVIPSRRWQSQY